MFIILETTAFVNLSHGFFEKVNNARGRFAPHTKAKLRRESGITSILRSKISAQAEFTSAVK